MFPQGPAIEMLQYQLCRISVIYLLRFAQIEANLVYL